MGGEDDPKRLECEVKELPANYTEPKKKVRQREYSTRRDIFDAVNNVIQRIDKNWIVKKCSFFKSLPGGGEQKVHRDYSVQEVENSLAK